MPFHAQDIRSALRHLRGGDPVLKDIIRQIGPFTLRTQPDRFRLLVRSIISQQISVGAARSILQRLEQAVAPEPISPAALRRFDPPRLRPLGISPQKASYLLDLVAKSTDGSLQLQRIGRLTDESAIEHLTQVRGIGRWTAQMFLIFGLGRLNVLPHADLGIQIAIRHNYRLRGNPKPRQIDRIAAAWQPYCSVACWYLWQSLDLVRRPAS